MQVVTCQGLKFYQFQALTRLGLRHAVFTRRGGHSSGPYQGLNLSFEVGDVPENVRRNRCLIKEALGLSVLLSAKQIHAKRAFILKDPPSRDLEVTGYDILITDQPGVGVLIKQADCQAIILFDSRRRVLALVHAGWRGLVAGVVEEALSLLPKEFDSRPEDLWAAISPSLGPCCAEFRDYQKIFPPEFWSFQVKKDYFDLPAITREKLLRGGLSKEKIFISGICTKCQPEFFSYRRERRTGRFGTLAVI